MLLHFAAVLHLLVLGTLAELPACSQSFLECVALVNCVYENCTLLVELQPGVQNFSFGDFTSKNCSIQLLLQQNYTQLLVQISATNFTMENSSLLMGYDTGQKLVYDQNYSGLAISASDSVKISYSGLSIYQSLFIYSGTQSNITNTIIQSYKFGLFTQNLLMESSIILSTASFTKGLCSCKAIGDCGFDQSRQLQSYISLYQFLTEQYQSFDLKTISQKWSSVTKNREQLLQDLTYYNYTNVIVASNTTSIVSKSDLSGGYVGVYTTYFYINKSNITTAGKGAGPSNGLGCGFLDWIVGLRLQCGGTGGSHGGLGGFSTSSSPNYQSTCSQMRSRDIYDDPFNPILEGSGGGGHSTYGSRGNGGGVIYIETYYAFIDGVITSDGNPAKDIFYGGGSGGSVQIRAYQNYGTGLVTASGAGSFNQQYGGIGAGGRIFVMQHGANDNYTLNLTSTIHFKALYGNVPQNQQNTSYNWTLSQGTIIMNPCQAGYFLNQSILQCAACPVGYYKALQDQSQCQKCLNYDALATYDGAQSSPYCKIIACQDYYVLDDLGKCVTWFQGFEESVGGENGVFAIIVAMFFLIMSIIIVWIRKQRKQGEDQFATTSMLFDEEINTIKRKQNSQQGIFTTQDLHYHVKRVYLTGTNTYNCPWQIYPETIEDFSIEFKQSLVQLFEDFNSQAKFTKLQKFTLIFLRFYYYPFYLMCQKTMSNNKYEMLQKFLEEHKLKALGGEGDMEFFKFSASGDFTLAYIDILNYGQDPIGWNAINKFPIHLILTGLGTFFYPIIINIKDPLVKLLWITYQRYSKFQDQSNEEDDEEEESDDESDESQENQVNTLEQFVRDFNFYAKYIDFRYSRNSFIKNFIKVLDIITTYNDEVFRANKKFRTRVSLCVHVLAKHAEDKSKFMILCTDNHKELEHCLGDIHTMHNFSKQYIIRFSLKFDELKGNENLDQIVIDTKNNINKQIEDCKVLDDRHIFDNLKKKMMSKLENGEQIRGKSWSSGFTEIFQNLKTQRQKKKQEQFLYSGKLCFLSLKRGFAVTLAQFSRYRQQKVNHKLLFLLLIFIVIFEWGFTIIYPAILIEEINSEKESQQQNLQGLFTAELILQLLIFPFSQIIAASLLTIWLLNSNRTLGKYFLVFNYCAVVSAFIEFFFGVIEMFVDYQDRLFNLLKLFQLVLMIAASYISCIQLNQLDKIEKI